MKTTVVNARKAHCEVNIMRPGKWGNPFTIGGLTTREAVIDAFARYLFDSGLIDDIAELRGKVLGCCCKPLACHGDVLAFWANKTPAEITLAVEYYRTYGKYPFRTAVQVVISDCASRSVRYGQEFHWVPGDREICCCSKEFMKNNLTEKQKSVTSVIPARDGHNNKQTTQDMNSKILALIAGVLATAFGQIKNILTGDGADVDDPPTPAAKKQKKAAPVEPEPDEEETELTLGGEAGDGDGDETPDVEEQRKECLALIKKLFKVETNKPKVKALLDKLGEPTLGDMDDDNVPKFLAALKKIK